MSKIRQAALWGALLCATVLAASQARAITIAVDVNANRKTINPNIYGVAFAGASDLASLNAPLNRWGGNSTTRYNWNLNGSNHASDWYFESIADSSSTAGASADTFISNTKTSGGSPLMTVPMIGWVAKFGTNRATLGSFSVAKYGPQTASDGDNGNGVSTAAGNPFITGNDPNDADVANSTAFELTWMQHLKSTWGAASAGGVKYYLMDNETGLWQSTHRDVHPVGPKMDEISADISSYAAMVKGNDSGAQIVAPEEWGWEGYLESGNDLQTGTGADRAAHGGMDYMPWLLQSLKSYDTAHGTKSIDVFSLHFYPQSGEYSNDDSAGTQAIRNKSTRSLWDPNYTDVSWIGTVVQLIPRMKSWVSTYYPGLQTGITEYNWGDEANMNGATTLADIWGIFGREGLDLATYWTLPANTTPTFQAMRLYRNYDGNKSTFGDTSCSCTVPNADQQSAFAAQRTSDNALTVMAINKITSATAATISIANFTGGATAQRWQVTGASITHLSDITVSGGNSISDTLPAQSVTLYVIPKSAGGVPSAPTGLTATAGNTQVTLAWTASSGATSYNVLRSTVNGSGYASVATGISTTSYTNTGLTNGTAYYFVVTATNASGTSGNSNQASATPVSGGTGSILSIDFVGGNGGVPSSMGTGESAGVVAATNWNNATGTTGSNLALHDNTGAGSGATVTWSAAGTWLTSITETAGNNRMMDGYLDDSNSGTTTVTVSSLPSGITGPTYDVYVYSDVAGGGQNCNYTIGSTTITCDHPGGVNFSGTFTQGNNSNGNYVKFSSLNAASFTLTANPASGYSRSPINGVQIVGHSGGGAPPAPTGLTATPGNAQVALAWAASSGATSYNVLRSTVNGSGYASVVTGVSVTNYTNTGLTNGTTYYFVVTATNSSGTSGNSNQASATPQVSAPAAPTGLTATPGNAQAALSWTASSGATSYNALRSTVNGSGYASVATGISTTNYTNTGLTNGTTYYFVVTATNAGGTSGNSNQASATPSAGGSMVSIDFVGGNGGVPSSMGSTESAGVVAATHWNNATGATGSGLALNYSTGSASGATVTWSAAGTWLTSITETAGNNRMMDGYLDDSSGGTTTVTLSSLPSAITANGYDVYVYSDVAGGGQNCNYTIGSTTITCDHAGGVVFNGTFTQGNNSNGNYVKFSSLSGTSFTLSATPVSGYNRAPVNGMQIVGH